MTNMIKELLQSTVYTPRMERIIISIIFCCFIPLLNHASTITINGLSYRYLNGEAHVSGLSDKTKTYIEIPSKITVDGIAYPVRSIDNSAFWGCKGVKSVTIPNSITSIGDSSFRECSGIVSLSWGNSINSIGACAFLNCTELTEVILPNSITSIGNSAFSGCTKLTKATLPNSLSTIREGLFINCTGLISVDLGESIVNIGHSAFNNCVNLKEVTIPNVVTEIEYWAFFNCQSLTHLTIPNSVTVIGESAFEYCTELKEVTLIDGDTELLIGPKLFNKCPIEKVYLGRNYKVLNSMMGTINRYYDGPFYNHSTLSSVTVGNNVTSITENAFYKCEGLTDLTLGTSVNSIGANAFYYCTGFLSIEFPSSVTYIGENALYGCFSLTEIRCQAFLPPKAYLNTFENNSYYKASLIVPLDSKKIYSDDSIWGNFKTIIEEDDPDNSVFTVTDEGENIKVLVSDHNINVIAPDYLPVDIYTISGNHIYSTYPGILELPQQNVYIIAVGNRRFKIAL